MEQNTEDKKTKTNITESLKTKNEKGIKEKHKLKWHKQEGTGKNLKKNQRKETADIATHRIGNPTIDVWWKVDLS